MSNNPNFAGGVLLDTRPEVPSAPAPEWSTERNLGTTAATNTIEEAAEEAAILAALEDIIPEGDSGTGKFNSRVK